MDRTEGLYTIKELKNGEFFKLKADSKRVYIRREYDRSEKKYSCIAFDDVNMERMFVGSKQVYAGFIF